jgi:GTPase
VQQVATPKILVVNKIDLTHRGAVAEHLAIAAAELGEFDAYVPLSARTGDGLSGLIDELESRLPEGPHYYPDGVTTDQPEMFLAAELLREQLLRMAREELPHAITVIAEEIEPDDDEERAAKADESGADDSGADESDEGDGLLRIRARILVERESQKGIVIGRGGAVLKEAGTRARKELEALLGTRVYLETRVAVERDWQRRAHALDRLGY